MMLILSPWFAFGCWMVLLEAILEDTRDVA